MPHEEGVGLELGAPGDGHLDMAAVVVDADGGTAAHLHGIHEGPGRSGELAADVGEGLGPNALRAL